MEREKSYQWQPAAETADRPGNYPESLGVALDHQLRMVSTWPAAVSIARTVANQLVASGQVGERPATVAEIAWARSFAGPL